jgi:hypothetical protein
VIDGVTARDPARYDGMLSGQFAADLVQRTLQISNDGDGLDLVRRLTATLAAAHARFGLEELARTDANRRFSTTLALALDHGAEIEIVLVGDSGVRVNGTALHQVSKDLDGITAALRGAAWRRAALDTDDPAECERLSRAATMQGTRHAEVFSPAAMRDIGEAAAAACATRWPTIGPDLIRELIEGGIVNSQKRHQNNPHSPLGYSCLDGTEIPEALISRVLLKAADVREIELFSDGYFAPGAAFGIGAWEQRFAEVEREDPAKIGRYASVKGSVGGLWSDDRTYVGIVR